MSIFEFDQEREWKLIRETEYQYGVEDGREEGREKAYLIQCICKKLRKGKDVERIAEELEEEVSTVESFLYTLNRSRDWHKKIPQVNLDCY